MLRLAESLGAETVTLDGPTAGATIAEYAVTRKATRVIVGAPKRRGLRALLRPSTATQLTRLARGFDVVTIAAADGRQGTGRAEPTRGTRHGDDAATAPQALRMGGWDLDREHRARLDDRCSCIRLSSSRTS